MPGAILLGLRLVLAAVFAVAGAAKLVDRPGTRAALLGFGAPARAVPVLAVLVPLAELAVAAALLPSGSARAAAIAALILLLVFTAAIGRALLRGEAPDCHCFGQLHSQPAGIPTLLRNVALAVAAGCVVLSGDDPGPSALAWLGRLSPAGVAAVAAGGVAVLLATLGTWALLAGLRAHGRVLLRVERLEAQLAEAGLAPDDVDDQEAPGVPIGDPAPAFALAATAGPAVSLADVLEPRRPALLVFTDPTCGPCAELMPEIATWQREDADVLTVVAISAGAAADVAAEARRHGIRRVLHDGDRAVAEAYEAHGTPAAVLVAADGTMASGVGFGAEGVRRLRDRALGPRLQVLRVEPRSAMGDPAPALVLPTLDGGTVDLARPRGRPTVLLFWNPACGFCRQMRERVRAWEAQRSPFAPELVVISSGAAEAIRADGFASTVLLDDDFAAGSAFGADGTPMAVMLDGDGRIASAVVAGADAVLELAGSEAALA